MSTQVLQLSYLLSAICFILALKGLSSPKSAQRGNIIGILGMVTALTATFFLPNFLEKIPVFVVIAFGGVVGSYIAKNIAMTAMPQLVAGFHSFVGLAAVLVAYSCKLAPENFGIGIIHNLSTGAKLEMIIGAAIGAVTFSGSLMAFAKLQGLINSGNIKFPGQQYLCMFLAVLTCILMGLFVDSENIYAFNLVILLSLVLGVLLIIPIGGADMPVIVSMLNSYSGWAAAGIGFSIDNKLLIITGALVGASGAILSHTMCQAMNRSLFKVIFGAFLKSTKHVTSGNQEEKAINVSNFEDAAQLLQNASSVIIVPGYGMAVAQSQHVIKELVELLEKEGISVKFAIHPVAGRMPGHMNVLLAEANIDYEKVFELEDINREFKNTDVVLVIGANDVTNPAAKTDSTSPIYGMPILEVEKARTVLFVKRSMAAGYAGIENELFYKTNTLMLFGDAKAVIEGILKSLS